MMVSMPCANFFFTVAKSSTAPLFFASTSEGVLVYDVRVPQSAAGGDAACPDEDTGMLPGYRVVPALLLGLTTSVLQG